jgi:TP901 family phage tail tape measure protein
MAMNAVQTGVGIVISAVDRASGPLRSIRSSFGNFRSEFKKRTEIKDPMMASIFKGMLGVGLKKTGSALTGINDSILGQTEDIRTAMRQVKAAAGASADELQRMKASLSSRAVAETGVGAGDAARALGQLAKETNSAAAAQTMLIPTLRFARMTEQDAAAGASALSDVMDVFKLKAEDAGATTDKLAWLMKNFGVQGGEVYSLFAGAAAGANLAQQSFQDTALAVGIMKKVFPDAGKAAMATNTALNQLAGDKTQKELKKLGVEVKDGTTKRMRGLTDVLIDVIEKTKGMDDATRANALAGAFGGRAAGGMSVIIDYLAEGIRNAAGETLKGADAMRYLKQQMDESSGSSKEMADAMTSSSDRLKAARARFPALFEDAAKSMKDVVRIPMTKTLNALADALRAFSPGMRKAILGIATALGVVLTVIGSFTVATAAMKAFGISIWGVIWSAVKVAAVFVVLLPLIVGLAVGFYTLYRAARKNVGGVADSWEDLKKKFKLGWNAMIAIISEGKLSRAMTRELHKSGNEGVLKFVEMVDRGRKAFQAWWKGMLAGIDEGAARLGPQIDALRSKWGWLIDIFRGEAFKGPLDMYADAGKAAGIQLSNLGAIAADALGRVGEFGGKLVDVLGSITTDDITMFIEDCTLLIFDLYGALLSLGEALGVVGQVLSFVSKILTNIYQLFRGAGEAMSMGVDFVSNLNKGFTAEQIGATQFMQEHLKVLQHQPTAMVETWTGTPADRKREKRRADLEQIRRLKERQRDYMEWFETPDKAWTKTKYSYERAPEAMRQSEILAFNALAAEIRRLGGRPLVVMLDGKKVGEGVEDAGAGENARDLGGGKTARTFGSATPVPAAGR